MIFAYVKPAFVDSWLKTNAAATSTRRSTKDNWRAYLAANGGTGNSLDELESSFLRAQGHTGTLSEAWNKYLSGSGTVRDKFRNRYK